MKSHTTVKNRTRDEIANFVQRSYDLYVLCLDHKDDLIKSNFPWALVEDIPGLVSTCSDLESSYRIFIAKRKKSSVQIATEFSTARKRTGTLLRKLQRLLDINSIRTPMPHLTTCTKREQFIQFLSNLTLLGEQYTTIFDNHMQNEFEWIDEKTSVLSELLTSHRLLFSVSIHPGKQRNAALAQLTQTCKKIKDLAFPIMHHSEQWKNLYFMPKD